MRAADVRKERAAREQREADDRAMEARKLAGMGYSVAEITEELNRVGIVRGTSLAKLFVPLILKP